MTQALKDLLIENGLSEYLELLEAQHLDSEDLLADLNQNDFEKMGITLIGDQKRLIKLFAHKGTIPAEIVPYNTEATPVLFKDESSSNNDSGNNEDDKNKQPSVVINNNPGGGSGVHGAVGGIIGAIIGVIIAGVFIFWVIDRVFRMF